MATTATRLTAEHYYAVTEVGDRKQLVAGEVVVNEPKLIHAHLQGRFLLLTSPLLPGFRLTISELFSR